MLNINAVVSLSVWNMWILSCCSKSLNSVLFFLSPLVVTICSNPNKYADIKLQTAASLTLAKMMMVSSRFCEDHIQLLVTVLEKSTEPVTRSNLTVALGDLSYRFPNIIVPWTSHIYGRWEIHTTCLCYVYLCSPVSAWCMLCWLLPHIIKQNTHTHTYIYIWQLRMSHHVLVLCLVFFTSVSIMFASLITYLSCEVEHNYIKLGVP